MILITASASPDGQILPICQDSQTPKGWKQNRHIHLNQAGIRVGSLRKGCCCQQWHLRDCRWWSCGGLLWVHNQCHLGLSPSAPSNPSQCPKMKKKIRRTFRRFEDISKCHEMPMCTTVGLLAEILSRSRQKLSKHSIAYDSHKS